MKRTYTTPVMLACMIAQAGCAAAPQRRSAAEVEAEAGFIREIRNVLAVIPNGRMFDTAAIRRGVGSQHGRQP
jgi:hypothetical protein